MNKAVLLIIILILIVTGAFFIMKIQNNKQEGLNSSSNATENKSTEANEKTKVPGTTIEGPIIAINEKEIAIGNGSPQPELISISATTPVVKLGKDEKETQAGLSDVKSGSKARVLFNENKETKKKVAERIYLLKE